MNKKNEISIDSKKIKITFSEKLNDIFSREDEFKKTDFLIIATKQRSILKILENFSKEKKFKELILSVSSIDIKNIQEINELNCLKKEIFIDAARFDKLRKSDKSKQDDFFNLIKMNKEDSHIKVMLLHHGYSYYVINGSGNAVTGGAKHEQYFLTESKELYEFFKMNIYENIQ